MSNCKVCGKSSRIVGCLVGSVCVACERGDKTADEKEKKRKQAVRELTKTLKRIGHHMIEDIAEELVELGWRKI